jgi:hypothetical protein
MSTPDYRIRFDAPRIDFDNNVGNLSQDIDNYPQPNSQARYDHMRMVILGLLANQASENEPSQYREGSLWFDLKTEELKIRKGENWVDISESISLGEDLSLKSWYESTSESLKSIKSEIIYHGTVISLGITSIPIPQTVRKFIDNNSVPLVYLNGILLETQSVAINSIINPTAINISSQNVPQNSKFTVIIKNLPTTNYIEEPIII